MNRQYVWLTGTALVAFGGFTGVLIAARNDIHTDVMMAVFFAGSVGAVVNNYYRLAKLSTSAEKLQTELERSSIIIQIAVSPFLSGIIGFVAYGLFLSGLLQGELFPKFTCLEGGYQGIGDLLEHVAPASNLDAAKALMWSFVAGFSERFVPNVLDSLVLKAERLEKSN